MDAPSTKEGLMPQKTAKPKTPAARTRKPAAKRSAPARKPAAAAPKGAIDKTAELSEDVLKSVESGQRAAIEAVRRFVDTVDDALPAAGDRPSRRERVIDAALEMADRLVTTQYEFLRSVVKSADRSLGKQGATKRATKK
jgi:hypothetical protein